MEITYRTDSDLDRDTLQGLFNAVGWSSARHPRLLQLGIRNSHHVVTAWEGERLVGLMNALADGL